MPRRVREPDPLKWIRNYETYLKAHRTRVFNAKALEIMKSDSRTKASAIRALKRFGYLDADGEVSRNYASNNR